MPINLIWSLPYRVRDDVDRVVEGAVQVKDAQALRGRATAGQLGSDHRLAVAAAVADLRDAAGRDQRVHRRSRPAVPQRLGGLGEQDAPAQRRDLAAARAGAYLGTTDEILVAGDLHGA